jgi:F420-dependent oxidoreductase-like protein
MKLGIMVEGQEGLTWDRWRRIMAAVEALGFESIWRSDHFLSIHGADRESLETWVSLTLTAVETKRLRFGPLVCPMTFRHPALLARMAAAVDVLSGGRLVLGVGAGWNEAEHRVYGMRFPSVQERLDMLEEGIQVIRGLLGDEPFSFSGRHYQLEGANPRPKPTGRVPLLIGGGGERRTLRIVARYADEWNLTTASPAVYRAKSERLDAYCREIGRDPCEIKRSVSVGYLVGRDDDDLLERCRAMQRLIPWLGEIETAAVPEAVRQVGWVVGRAEQIVEQLRALAEAGAEWATLQHNDQEDFEALELVAREVLPALDG